jgi:hypothetical protein
MRVFHVSPAVNRESIARFGLDPKHMGAALGIAGSPEPEEDGVFVARDIHEIVWFVQMGEGRHAALDIWEVTLPWEFDVSVEPPPDVPFREIDGYLFLRELVSPDRVRLMEQAEISRLSP